MSDLFKLNYKYSTSHLVMPTIVGGVLVLLIVIMLIQRASRCRNLPFTGATSIAGIPASCCRATAASRAGSCPTSVSLK